jgi:hypothetical protein
MKGSQVSIGPPGQEGQSPAGDTFIALRALKPKPILSFSDIVGAAPVNRLPLGDQLPVACGPGIRSHESRTGP